VLTERRKKEIASLNRRKNRDERGEFLVEGVRSVRAAIDGGATVTELLSTSNAGEENLAGLVDKRGGKYYVISPREMNKFSAVRESQGILAVCSIPRLNPEDILVSSTVLLLDGVQDPGNVGTLVRTAGWFGIEAVLSGPGTADFFNPKTVRSSMGGIWDLKLAETDNPVEWITQFRSEGGLVYAADMSGSDVNSFEFRRPSALVIGSEARGISDVVRKVVDHLVHIPGPARRGATESLNAGVAGGLIMARWVTGQSK